MRYAAYFKFILALVVSYLPAFASAEETEGKTGPAGTELETEHIFGFAEGSDIGSKGEAEIENVTAGAFGRIGSYNNADDETSFRYGAADHLRLSIGTLTDYYNIHNVLGLDSRSQVSFSGLITEIRWNIIERANAPFGMTLSVNPSWRQFDGDTGERTGNYAIPVTLLIDKELIPEKLFGALNFIYTPSFLRVNGVRGYDDAVTFIAAGTYAIAPHVLLGAEIRHENLAENGTFGAHALFIGPSLYYQATEKLSVKAAWAIQIPDAGSSRLDLSAYERHQVELQFAYHF